VYRSTKAWDARAHHLVFLGRLVSEKGCDRVIGAVGALAARGLFPAITIVGDGEDREKLQAMTVRFGLPNRINFTGALAPSAIAQVLTDHRFLVVPSRREGFGMVALEGLGCGCVPLVSRCGGLTEAIGSHGYSFDNRDPGEPARLLEHVLTQPEEAQAKLHGVDKHLVNFAAHRVAARYIELFEDILT
jgi:glycosyltransferase involved in cell wall biosynthesis